MFFPEKQDCRFPVWLIRSMESMESIDSMESIGSMESMESLESELGISDGGKFSVGLAQGFSQQGPITRTESREPPAHLSGQSRSMDWWALIYKNEQWLKQKQRTRLGNSAIKRLGRRTSRLMTHR